MSSVIQQGGCGTGEGRRSPGQSRASPAASRGARCAWPCGGRGWARSPHTSPLLGPRRMLAPWLTHEEHGDWWARGNAARGDGQTRCERLFPRETGVPGKLERPLLLPHSGRSRRPRVSCPQVAGMTRLRGHHGKEPGSVAQGQCYRRAGEGGVVNLSVFLQEPQTRLRCTETAEGPGGLKRDRHSGELTDRTAEPTFQNEGFFSSLGQADRALAWGLGKGRSRPCSWVVLGRWEAPPPTPHPPPGRVRATQPAGVRSEIRGPPGVGDDKGLSKCRRAQSPFRGRGAGRPGPWPP